MALIKDSPYMKLRIIFSLFACLSALQVSANSVEFIRDGELYLGIGQYNHDSGRGLDTGRGIEFGFERPITTDLSWDIWYSGYKADGSEGDSGTRIKRLTPGLLYHLNEGNTRSFVNAGFGHQKFWYKSIPEARETSFQLGGGVKFYKENNFILRGEVLALYSFDEEHADYGARLTLGYSFGREFVREPLKPEPLPEPEPMPEPEPAPEPEPIPEPEPVPEPLPEPEPTDEDLDGVFDDVDLCPGTNPEHKVDETGCSVSITEQISIEMDIKFLPNSDELTLEYYPEVKKVVDLMKEVATTTVTVEGHTDSQGSRKYNQALSQKRAESVRRAMIDDFGIEEGRVEAIGYGEERPLVENDTQEGRAKNRRVVAVLEAQITKQALRD